MKTTRTGTTALPLDREQRSFRARRRIFTKLLHNTSKAARGLSLNVSMCVCMRFGTFSTKDRKLSLLLRGRRGTELGNGVVFGRDRLHSCLGSETAEGRDANTKTTNVPRFSAL